MTAYQFKPRIDVRFSPRIRITMRTEIGRVCRRREMLEADVVHYCVEAAALLVHARKWRLARSPADTELDAMVTIRTTTRFAGIMREVLHREQQADKDLVLAVVLRRLIATFLPVAKAKGVAHIMALRERELDRLNSRRRR